MTHVEEVNDIYELASYRLLWNALLPQTRGATFFQSFDWLQVYWKHYGHRQRLRVLVVCHDRRPLGILPLVVRTEATRIGPVRVLTYPLDCWGTFYGPIGPNPTATLSAGLRHIRNTTRDWDLVDLRFVDHDGVDRGRTEGAMRRVGFSAHKQAWGRSAMIEMRDGWGQYWRSRDKKWRHNTERCERRLAEQGTLEHLRYRPQGAIQGDGDPRFDLFEHCLNVARRSWQATSSTGTTLCHDGVCDYLRETHAAAARNGSLDVNLLLLDGRPIAFIYNYHYGSRVYGLRKGFDSEFSCLRPGLVLQRMVVEDSFCRGDACYDMGLGYLDAKRHWQTSLATSYRYTYFPKTVARVQLLRMKRWLQNKIYGAQPTACVQPA